jgi:hypothetical protein
MSEERGSSNLTTDKNCPPTIPSRWAVLSHLLYMTLVDSNFSTLLTQVNLQRFQFHTVLKAQGGEELADITRITQTLAFESPECPQQDSNLRFSLRRAALYPLSYGGNWQSVYHLFCFLTRPFSNQGASRIWGEISGVRV